MDGLIGWFVGGGWMVEGLVGCLVGSVVNAGKGGFKLALKLKGVLL